MNNRKIIFMLLLSLVFLFAGHGIFAQETEETVKYDTENNKDKVIITAEETEEGLIVQGESMLIAQRAPMGGNGKPMRATMYGWQTNTVPNRQVNVRPSQPIHPGRSYWDNYYLYGPGWVGGTSNPDTLPGAGVKANNPPPARDYRKPPTIEEQAEKTVYSFMGALKYSDVNRANSMLSPSLRSGGSTTYINNRLGKVQNSRVVSSKRTGNSVQVRMQYQYQVSPGRWVVETKTFTVSGGMIVNPL